MCNGMCSVVAFPVSAITGLLAFGLNMELTFCKYRTVLFLMPEILHNSLEDIFLSLPLNRQRNGYSTLYPPLENFILLLWCDGESYCDSLMCTTHDQYICGFYPAMNIIKMHTDVVVCKHTISLEVCCHTYSVLTYTAQLSVLSH